MLHLDPRHHALADAFGLGVAVLIAIRALILWLSRSSQL
jgi:hypothetical protein